MLRAALTVPMPTPVKIGTPLGIPWILTVELMMSPKMPAGALPIAVIVVSSRALSVRPAVGAGLPIVPAVIVPTLLLTGSTTTARGVTMPAFRTVERNCRLAVIDVTLPLKRLKLSVLASPATVRVPSPTPALVPVATSVTLLKLPKSPGAGKVVLPVVVIVAKEFAFSDPVVQLMAVVAATLPMDSIFEVLTWPRLRVVTLPIKSPLGLFAPPGRPSEKFWAIFEVTDVTVFWISNWPVTLLAIVAVPSPAVVELSVFRLVSRLTMKSPSTKVRGTPVVLMVPKRSAVTVSNPTVLL